MDLCRGAARFFRFPCGGEAISLFLYVLPKCFGWGQIALFSVRAVRTVRTRFQSLKLHYVQCTYCT